MAYLGMYEMFYVPPAVKFLHQRYACVYCGFLAIILSPVLVESNPLSYRYLELLAKFPVLTKAVTSAFLTLIGDLICQFLLMVFGKADILAIEHGIKDLHVHFLGAGAGGSNSAFLVRLQNPNTTSISHHCTYILVNWSLYLELLAHSCVSFLIRVDLRVLQFLFAPMFIGVFLSSLVALEGRPAEVIPKLQQEWFSSVLANWQLWIPFQFVNFRFVPQQFQVLASNFVALIWNVILSFKAHKEVVPK
ncbi:hypothetical protein Cgig2_020390 [Carnegiea gigantea]|uniref:Uncharacterized protein n=1 Tax=Carnegiea gigantea TaxID=171969 RepID=A0A9Q1QDC7_9CARY|nr:hypothetical protein Cgig2_020390 [Carnegiea gigantea]